MSNLLPEPLTKDELIQVLEDILHLVKIDDSFEGNIEYLMPDVDSPEGTDFLVRGVYRIGNSMGQGGVRMYGTVPGMEVSRDGSRSDTQAQQ